MLVRRLEFWNQSFFKPKRSLEWLFWSHIFLVCRRGCGTVILPSLLSSLRGSYPWGHRGRKEMRYYSRLLTSPCREAGLPLHAGSTGTGEEWGMREPKKGFKKPPHAPCSQPGHFMNHTGSWRNHQHPEEPHVYRTSTQSTDCCWKPQLCSLMIIHTTAGLQNQYGEFPSTLTQTQKYSFYHISGSRCSIHIPFPSMFSFSPSLKMHRSSSSSSHCW